MRYAIFLLLQHPLFYYLKTGGNTRWFTKWQFTESRMEPVQEPVPC